MARIRAGDPSGLGYWTGLAEEYAEKGWYHSIELPDGRVTQGLQSVGQLKSRLRQFPAPEDLTGKRVLDIGAWDGWFSFEMERRGAEVMAVDCIEQPGFLIARELLGSKVEYRVLDVLDLSPDKIGRFDIVLFFGVLYHLKHPLLGLEKICELTKEMALVESFVTDDETSGDTNGPATMEFYETDELCGRLDNWVGPNIACLQAFCRTAGFARVELCSVIEQRAHVTCYRRWEEAPAQPSEVKPVLTEAINIRTHDRHFSRNRDDYLSIWLQTGRKDLDRTTILPEVSGYGVRPVYVEQTALEVWQANFKLPPGLDPGRHEVRVRTTNSPLSDPQFIAVDQPRPQPKIDQLSIAGVTDGKTWEQNLVRLSRDSWVSLWVSGLPGDVAREQVSVRLGEATLRVSFLSPPDKDKLRQVNARLPESAVPGHYRLSVSCGGAVSAPVKIRVAPPSTP